LPRALSPESLAPKETRLLDPRIPDLVARRLQVEQEQRWAALAADVNRIKGEMASRNTLQSSATVDRIAKRCAQEVTTWATIVAQRVLQTAVAVGVEPNEGLGAELKTLIHRYLPETLTRSTVEDAVRTAFAPNQPMYSSMRERKGTLITTARQQALQTADTEVDLFVAQLERDRAQGTATVPGGVTIYGNVGAVQTGIGATAHVVQAFDTAEREMLCEALGMVAQSLQALDPHEYVFRQDVLELLREVEEEAEKEKPNSLRLRSILMGVAMTIQTIPAVQPAYATLKGAVATLFGIALP
jgi:hypothetical protein